MSNPDFHIRHITVRTASLSLHVAEAGAIGRGRAAATVGADANINTNANATKRAETELILFLHGFPECWYSWRHIMRELSDDFLTVAPDCRGYNLSGKPSGVESYSISHICDDIHALIAHYGAQKVTLVGHDWGGVAAWYFAARFPQHVTRLVTINAPHPNRFQSALNHDPAQRAASQYINRLRDAGSEARLQSAGLEQFWIMLFGDLEKKSFFTSADKAVYLEAWSQPGALTGMLNWYRAAPFIVPALETPLHKNIESREWAEDVIVDVPTLVIWGMQDNILLPCLLDGLLPYVPRLTVYRIAEGGHGAIHEMPHLIASMIRGFIKSA